MEKAGYLLAKFGDKEHLEQLQQGGIFFNSIEIYRNERTNYRGDVMEGRLPVDPQRIEIYGRDGKRLFEKYPRPSSVYEGIFGDEEIKMFCASAITIEIMNKVGDDVWCFKEPFKDAIHKFGKYVLLIWSEELIKRITDVGCVDDQKIFYDSGLVQYMDLRDYEKINIYRQSQNLDDRYFVKDISYRNQNEWRVIISGEKKPLTVNYKDGFLLKSYPFENSRLMKIDELLNGRIANFINYCNGDN